MGLTQSKPFSTDPKKTGGFFLHNQYSVGRPLIFLTPHRNTYKHRTEEQKNIRERKTRLKLPKNF